MKLDAVLTNTAFGEWIGTEPLSLVFRAFLHHELWSAPSPFAFTDSFGGFSRHFHLLPLLVIQWILSSRRWAFIATVFIL